MLGAPRMSTSSLRILAALLFVGAPVLAVGCGGKVTSGTTSGPIPVEGICDALAKVACDQPARCCSAAGHSFDVIACRLETSADCNESIARYQAAGLGYDAAAAGRCLDAFQAAYAGCGTGEADLEVVSAACDTVFVGNVPQGGACEDDEECAPVAGRTTDCVSHSSGSRRCSVRARSGEACGPTASGWVACERGLSCSSGSGTGTCVAPEDPPALGASCDVSCAAGAYCSGGTCVATKPAGASCASSLECATGRCRSGKCVDAWSDAASCKGGDTVEESTDPPSSGPGAAP